MTNKIQEPKAGKNAVAEPSGQGSAITPEDRAAVMGQTPKCIWFTGLSGSGKSTLANALDQTLHSQGLKTFLLDGDNIRQGLTKDLGMSKADRTENIRRAGEVAKLMLDAGLIVICAFISPYQRDRERVRAIFQPGDFVEVYLSTPLAICEQRDPKGLYQKARQGVIKQFTGVSDPYEAPISPEIAINTSQTDINQSLGSILDWLKIQHT